jgi:hypothetical protein
MDDLVHNQLLPNSTIIGQCQYQDLSIIREAVITFLYNPINNIDYNNIVVREIYPILDNIDDLQMRKRSLKTVKMSLL